LIARPCVQPFPPGCSLAFGRLSVLMTLYLEQYLDLFGSFETCFRYQGGS